MNRINFEEFSPPVISVSEINAEISKRKLRRQITIVALSGLLTQLVMIFATFYQYQINPLAAVFCGLYCIFSITSGSVLTIIFYQKRRNLS